MPIQHYYKQIYGFDTYMEKINKDDDVKNNITDNNIEQIEEIIDIESYFSNYSLYCSEEEMTKEQINNQNNLKKYNICQDKEQIKEIINFTNFCYELLNNEEKIFGMEAFNNIIMLLFLKIISKNVIDGTIDLLNIEKYRKIENTRKYYIFLKYKDYIQHGYFNNIIENGKLKVEDCELIFIVEFLYIHVLWFHPITKNIFPNIYPSIKKDITYKQIFKKLDKLNLNNIDINKDIKSLIIANFINNNWI